VKKDVLYTYGEAFERLLANPDFHLLQRHIQNCIDVTKSIVLQGNFKEFPKDYWTALGILGGLGMIERDMTRTIKEMNAQKEKDNEEGRRNRRRVKQKNS